MSKKKEKKGYKSIPIGGTITKPGSSEEYKTGNWRTFRPVKDESKCTNCLLCAVFCPENCIKTKDGRIERIDLDYCKGCGICAHECPNNAITMQKEECGVE